MFRSTRDGYSEIYVMNADGTGLTRLTYGSGSIPCWSPNGRKIAFQRWRDGKADIYTMNADGTGLERLTENVYNDHLGDWGHGPLPIKE